MCDRNCQLLVVVVAWRLFFVQVQGLSMDDRATVTLNGSDELKSWATGQSEFGDDFYGPLVNSKKKNKYASGKKLMY